MRNINWDAALSDEDKAWVRQAGLVRGEERIAENEARHGDARSIDDVEVMPDPSKSVLDPTATASHGPVATANVEAPDDEDEEGGDSTDPYLGWTKGDLEDEINDRNTDPTRTRAAIEVTGTGSKGNVLAKDMLAALRADDSAAATEA